MSEHAVLLYITALAGDSTGVDEMEDLLIGAIQTAGAGEFDGNAVGPEGAVLYMYGPDADALWAAIESVVRAAPLSPGCYAIKRYGDPGAMEARVDLT